MNCAVSFLFTRILIMACTLHSVLGTAMKPEGAGIHRQRACQALLDTAAEGLG